MARSCRLLGDLWSSCREWLHPVLSGWTCDSLDFLGADHPCDVGVLNDGSRCVSKVDRIDLLKCGFGENHETTDMATGGQLQKVKSRDAANVDSGNVSESSPATLILVDNEEGSLSVDVSSVSVLALSGTDVSAVANLLDVSVGFDGLEEGDCILGLLDALD